MTNFSIEGVHRAKRLIVADSKPPPANALRIGNVSPGDGVTMASQMDPARFRLQPALPETMSERVIESLGSAYRVTPGSVTMAVLYLHSNPHRRSSIRWQRLRVSAPAICSRARPTVPDQR